jgi:hypothetical protein
LRRTTTTSSSATDAVETTVPLIQKNEYDSSRTEQTKEIKEQADYMPWIQFIPVGICFGMVSSVIMYGSIEIVLNQYGENPTLQGALDHVVYGFLWLGTHVMSSAMVCVVIAFLLTKDGSKHFQRLLNENTDDFWDARSVFLGAVVFQGGSVLSYALIGFAFQSMLGFPPTCLTFVFVMILDLLVSCLVIRFYDWDREESNEESEVRKEDMYIVIV